MTDLAYSVVEEIIRCGGIHEVVIAAGARNIGMVNIFLAVSGLTVYHHFEERSAAFFALGRARCSGRPVALCVTSGTAVSELLSAAIEGYYSRTPILLITADRPARYRGTGAPQSIEQAAIYGPFVTQSYDLTDAGVRFSLSAWDRRSPVHINVCLEESKGHGPMQDLAVSFGEHAETVEDDDSIRIKQETIRFFLANSRSAAVILGALAPRTRTAVKRFCLRLQAPVYAEPLSGLREDPDLAALILRSGERIMNHGAFDHVIRIGDVPTLRYWRDLEAPEAPRVLSLSESAFSGMPGGRHVEGDLDRLLGDLAVSARPNDRVVSIDRRKCDELEGLFRAYPKSEVSLIRELSKAITGSSLVYLGNSLPIREWDLAADRTDRGLSFSANRGANGIDGQVSSFIGTIPDHSEGWGFIGDLTALYDSAALYLLPQRSSIRSRTVVINNGGGKIFSRVASTRQTMEWETARTVIENPHSASFAAWADLWQVPYRLYAAPSDLDDLPQHVVLEVRPDLDETVAFWNDYDRMWAIQ